MADCTHRSNGWVPLHVWEKSLNHAHSKCKVKHAGTSKELRTISQTVHTCRIDWKPRPWEVLSAGSARMSVPLSHQSNSDRYITLKRNMLSKRRNGHSGKIPTNLQAKRLSHSRSVNAVLPTNAPTAYLKKLRCTASLPKLQH